MRRWGHICGKPHRCSFNTASGMRSHATAAFPGTKSRATLFQYRKRYEVTCDVMTRIDKDLSHMFQYRKRYEVTCDIKSKILYVTKLSRFNTASGMRSHATLYVNEVELDNMGFNTASGMRSHATQAVCFGIDHLNVSIPQAV